MGTHGRNAVTVWKGKRRRHICHEQTMDGHDADYVFTAPFLDEGIIPEESHPTMDNETDECNHFRFAHIDYTRKILYTSYSHPIELLVELEEDMLDLKDAEEGWIDTTQLEKQLINLAKVNSQGWSCVFNCFKCPKEYKCINSSDLTTEGLLKEGKLLDAIYRATDTSQLAEGLAHPDYHKIARWKYKRLEEQLIRP